MNRTFTSREIVNLNLNGKTLTIGTSESQYDGLVVSDGATLNILSSSPGGKYIYDTGSTNYDAIFVNGGSLNIGNNVEAVVSPVAFSAINAQDGGEVVLDGGIITITDEDEHQVGAVQMRGDSKFIMRSGEINICVKGNETFNEWTDDACAIVAFDDGNEIYLYGGKITVSGGISFVQGIQLAEHNGACDSGYVLNGTDFELSGNSDGVCVLFAPYDPDDGSIKINSGRFEGDYTALYEGYYSGTPNATITGGTFYNIGKDKLEEFVPKDGDEECVILGDGPCAVVTQTDADSALVEFSDDGQSDKTSAFDLVLTTPIRGGIILYSFDEATPSQVYDRPIRISESCKVNAVVKLGDYVHQIVKHVEYDVDIPVAPSAPTYVIDGMTGDSQGTYTGAVTVTFVGTNVRYTLDGTNPTATTGKIGATVSVSESCIIKAISVSGESLCSAVVSVPITIQTVSEEGTTTITPPTSESVTVGGDVVNDVIKTEITVIDTSTNTTSVTTELKKDTVTTQATVTTKADGTTEETVFATIDATENIDASIDMAIAQIEKASELANIESSNVQKEIVINTGATVEVIQVSEDAISAVAGKDGVGLTVSNNQVAVTLDNKTLNGLSGDLKIDVKQPEKNTLTSAQQAIVRDNIVVTVNVTAGNDAVSKLDGKALIKIPVSLEAVMTHDVFHVSSTGALEEMHILDRVADGENSYILIETGHFSAFMAIHPNDVPSNTVPPTFIPIPDDDFLPPVQVVKPQEDDTTTKIACVAAGAVAALLAILLVATSRGKL